MPENNATPITELKQRMNGFEEESPVQTLKKYNKKFDTKKPINPEDALFATSVVGQRNSMLDENGMAPIVTEQERAPQAPTNKKGFEGVYQASEEDKEAESEAYNRVKTAFNSKERIQNLDKITRDFSNLSEERQHDILKSISQEDNNRTLQAVGNKIQQDLVNLDLTKEENREEARKAIKYGMAAKNKKEWSKEDVLEGAYKDVAASYIHKEGKANHLEISNKVSMLAKKDQEKLGTFVSDVAFGISLGASFAPSIIAKTGMSASKYASLLVAGEVTISGAAEKLTEKYGMKGLLPIIPLAIVLAPETLVGASRFGVRGVKNVVSKGKYSVRDLTATSIKGTKSYKDTLYNTTTLGTRMGDDISDEISKNIGRQIGILAETPAQNGVSTAMSVIESTADEYKRLKLPIKLRMKPTTDTDKSYRFTQILPKASDDGSIRLAEEGMNTTPTALFSEEYVNRTIQTGAPAVDVRLYNQYKNLVNQHAYASGIRDTIEKKTFIEAKTKIKQLPKLKGEERERAFNEIIDDIDRGAHEINNYSNKVISQTNFADDAKDFVATIANKSAPKHMWDTTFWNGWVFNPFYNTKLDKVIRKDFGFMDAMSVRFENTVKSLNRSILKKLSKKESEVFNKLVETSSDIEKRFESVEDIKAFNEALASRVSPKVFQAYKETRQVLDTLGKHLSNSYATKLRKAGAKMVDVEDGYRIVKPTDEIMEDGNIKVLDLEEGTHFTVPKEALNEIDEERFLLEGYFPRMVEGDINVTVLDSEGRKIKEMRGFASTSDAGRAALKEEANMNPGDGVVIHHKSKNPVPVGTKKHLLQEIDEFSDLGDIDSLVGMFKANGASLENIEDFIHLMDEESIKRYRDMIEFNRIQTGASKLMKKRRFRAVAGAPGEKELANYRKQIKEYVVNRLDAENSLDRYTEIFTRSIGIDKMKNNLKQEFISKFGHLLQKDEMGSVDWLRFNDQAYKDADSATRVAAKHIQDQLRRIHKMPTNAELKFNDMISSMKEKWFKRYAKSTTPGITKKMNLSSDLAQEGNNATTAFLGTTMLFFEPFYVMLQGFQAVPTLLANPDVAVEALTKSIKHTTKGFLRGNPITSGLKSTTDEEWEILKKSGLFENVEIEEALGKYKLSRWSSKPMVWGELSQRMVAANTALAKARKLGLKGDDLIRFVYDEGSKYALDMSNYSKRAISEGFFKWNIGLFSRYFTQIGELFWKGMKPDQKIATGLGLYELFGMEGIPFAGDVRNVYEQNRNHLVNLTAITTMWANDFEDEAINKDPAELVDAVFPEIDSNERYLKIQRLKEDNDYRKKLKLDVKKQDIQEALKDTKGIVDFFDKLFYKDGALSSLSGRMAYNDFITQKMKSDTFTTPLSMVKSAGNLATVGKDLVQAGLYASLGYNAPDEVRTEAYKRLVKDSRDFLGELSPNAFDMAQGLNIAANLASEDWENLLSVAQQDYIMTSSGKKIKPMEEATLEDALRLISGYGYREVYLARDKERKVKTLMYSLKSQAKKEAEQVYNEISIGNVQEVEKMNLAYTLRNKVYYGDTVSSQLYHNTYITHLNSLIEENRNGLANVYNKQKLDEIDFYLEQLIGMSLPESMWDEEAE